MSLDTVYADSIDEGLQRWARNPGPAPEPGFSMTSFLGAGGKAIPQAAMERGASAMDAMSGFGNILSATGGSAGGMFSIPTEAEQKQEAEARERMLKGDNQSVESGNQIRRKAEEFAPDPLTSHTADQVVHGIVRFGAKAMGDVATMGPVGAIVTGLDEGETTTQSLRTQGVDDATATKVGAVTGFFSAAGAVLPMGGKAGLQTLELVGVGGPGSYVAQEALSRQILEKAGQYDQASLHNPFDPLGLALSTLIPGGFGAMHMRGVYKRTEAVASGRAPLAQLTPQELRGLKYDDARLDQVASAAGERYGVPPALVLAIKNAGEKSGPTAVSPRGATGVMQFTEGTAKEMGLADRTDPVASIDAGARYLKKLYEAYGSWDAAVAHYNGGGTQAVLVRGGGQPSYNETRGYLDRVRKYMADHTAETAATKPENVDAARVSVLNDTVAKSLTDTPDAHAQMLKATDIVGESGGRAAEQQIAPVRDIDLPTFRNWFGDSKIVNERGEPAVMYHGTGSDVAAFNPMMPGPHTDMGAVFLTADSGVASHYANVGAMFGDKSPNVVPVYVSAKNPFDYENAAHRASVVDRVFETGETFLQGDGQKALILDGKKTLYTKGVLDAGLAEGRNWDLVERKIVQDAIKHEGHDGFWVMEDTKNLAVYDPASVKSAIGNSGKFDPNSASLTDPLKAGERSPREANNSLPAHDSVSLAGDEPAKRGAEVGAGPSKPGAAPSGEPAKPAADGAPEPSSPTATIDAQIAQKLVAEKPDMEVVLPGDERMTVAEAMKSIAETQKSDAQWADLVKVAVECALGG